MTFIEQNDLLYQVSFEIAFLIDCNINTSFQEGDATAQKDNDWVWEWSSRPEQLQAKYALTCLHFSSHSFVNIQNFLSIS